jgi:hypothetical protein
MNITEKLQQGIFIKKGMTTVTLAIKELKLLLTETNIQLPNSTVLINPLTLEERVRLGNWYMTYLATEVGKIDAPMTRKEMIEYLQSFDAVDPTGEMEVVYNDNGTMLEVNDVSLGEYGDEKLIIIK